MNAKIKRKLHLSKANHHCSSSYPYQMNPGDPRDFRGLDVAVEKLLQEEGCFSIGLTLTNDEIDSSTLMLGKDKNIFNSNLDYEYFLTKYGSLYGEDLNIHGPISHENDDFGQKVRDVVLTQNSFIKFGIELNIGLKLEFCWAVALYKGDFYYIDSSDREKGHIYRLGFNGRPQLFAINFVDFLSRISERYKLDRIQCRLDSIQQS